MMLWIVRNYMIGMLPYGGSIVELGENTFERGKSKVFLRYKPDKKKELEYKIELAMDTESNEKYVAKRLVAAIKEKGKDHDH